MTEILILIKNADDDELVVLTHNTLMPWCVCLKIFGGVKRMSIKVLTNKILI